MNDSMCWDKVVEDFTTYTKGVCLLAPGIMLSVNQLNKDTDLTDYLEQPHSITRNSKYKEKLIYVNQTKNSNALLWNCTKINFCETKAEKQCFGLTASH